MQKIRKVPCIDFSQKLKNFLPFLVPKQLFPKKSFASILSLFAAVISSKNKKSSMHWILIIPEKPHFGPIFTQKTSKQDFFPKKLISASFKLKKKTIAKFWIITFLNTWKISVWTYFGPFCPGNLKMVFLAKTSFRSTLRIYAAVTSLHSSIFD